MATWDDVRRLALQLPEATEREAHAGPAWRVRGKDFVWDRPLRAADRSALGARLPEGPVLGAYVEDLEAKDALLAALPDVCFTTPHFDGYPVVLVRLDRVALDDLEEVVVEAWLARSPRRLREQYLRERP